ncbi:MAG: HNH endonuclease [Rhodocyclales bacterium]|nr:HNH endonuclease [Rhodocyclales bacterium]
MKATHEDLALGLIAAGEYSVARSGVVYGRAGRALCQKPSPKGLLYVTLRHHGKRLYCAVHRLVARVFLGDPPPNMVAFHKNGVRADNRARNLTWVTPTESAERVKRLGLLRPARGEGHYSTILTVGRVRQIKMLLEKGVLSKRDIERAFSVGRGVVTAIAFGKSWKHAA